MANKFTQKLDKFKDIYRGKNKNDERVEAKLEEKQGELIQLEGKIQEQETFVSDLRKSYLLDEIKETSYLEAKAEFDEMIEKKATLKEEMELIQQYRQEDAKLILDELESYREKELKEEESKEVKEIKSAILTAKQKYLDELIEQSKRYEKVMGVHGTISSLKETLGIQKSSYVSDTYGSLGLIDIGVTHIPATVDQEEAHKAIQFKQVDSHLKSYVEGKKKAK